MHGCAVLLLPALVAGLSVPAQQWHELPPPARSSAASAYDPAHRCCVLFGGSNGVSRADTWQLQGNQWTKVLTTAAPPGRYGHALAHDIVRGRTVLFGGIDGSVALSDTWEFDGSNWLPVTPAVQPSARAWHALAYDSARGRTVMFGGRRGANNLAETWEYDGSNWTQITTAVTPPGRSYCALAYDSARGRVVLFGGLGIITLLADTWEYDGGNWTAVATPSTPTARLMHALAYDCMRGCTVMAGGATIGGLSATWWEYDGSNWTSVAAPPLPPPRSGPSLAFDSGRGRIVMFGGGVQDTWELLPPTTPTWTRHGLGCSSSAGTPALDRAPGALPALGTTFPLQFTALPAQPGALLLAFGFGIARWNGNALPIDLGATGLPGCKLWIEPGAGIVIGHGGGSGSFPLAIPNHAALAGVLIAAQALVFDPAAGNGIGVVTNAGVMRLN